MTSRLVTESCGASQNQLDPVAAANLGSRFRIEPARCDRRSAVAEEDFMAGGCAENDHPGRNWADRGEAVHGTPRGIREFSGGQPLQPAVAPQFERALQDVEGFILAGVPVARRTRAGRGGDAVDRHRARALRAVEKNLHVHPENLQTVRIGRNDRSGRKGSGHGSSVLVRYSDH